MSIFTDDEVYSVSRFLNLSAKTIANNIPVIWVSGEISNLSAPNSGHIYFSLKDKKSQVRCTLFKLSHRHLTFELENGMEIMVRSAANLYEIRGDFQLIIQRIQPIGVGSLELGFEQLKHKLRIQGLFDAQHKKSLTPFPKKIGIITSKSGAVIFDIMQVLSKRYPFAEIVVYDTPTQGVSASVKIIIALKRADTDHNDTLIIARGGGSREDLWCFNDEDLALAIFNAHTPIISSIGHETDSTIIDFVADVYAPTPSAAAMLVATDRLALLNNCQTLTQRLEYSARKYINTQQQNITAITQRISSPNLHKYYQLLDDISLSIQHLLRQHIRFQRSQLGALLSRLNANNQATKIAVQYHTNKKYYDLLVTSMQRTIHNKQTIITSLTTTLISLITHKLFLEKNSLEKNISHLNHLSPLQVLDRGYSITNIKHKTISSVTQLTRGDEITTQMRDGSIASIVK